MRGRGLKWVVHDHVVITASVAPSHEGAWIEIMMQLLDTLTTKSPPRMRGRGLKFLGDGAGEVNIEVAPSHEGAWIEIRRVPRSLCSESVAPSHEGAWIEI